MPKIDNITYPDETQAMLKDKDIGPLYRSYLDEKMCEWIYLYVDDAMSKRDPKTQFKKYFAKGAKNPVNIAGDALTNARRLGAAKDWKSKDWAGIYDEADRWVLRTAGDRDELFYEKSAAFKAHHVNALFKQYHRQKQPELMAELGVSDKKALANVAAMLKADKNKDGPRSAKAYVKKNRIQMKANEVIKKIKKAFKIK